MARRAFRGPSMADVAELAHVSHQTVSRVLNDHPHVRPETRMRVQEAIDTLGYRPNGAARALATSRSRTVGLITEGTNLHGPVSALLSFEQAARARGHHVSVISFPRLGPSCAREAMTHFRAQMVEAVAVIAAAPNADVVVEPLRTHVPVVLLSSDERAHPGVARVGIDQRSGATDVVDLLADLGHERIAFIAGPRGNFDAELRLDGWRQALTARGLPTPPVYLGSWQAASGYEAGRSLAAAVQAARNQAPTAVFVANDHMAMGVLRACWEAGLEVPGDLSVVGFDDVPGADQLWPPLTTVRQPFEALGTAAVEVLLRDVAPGVPDPVRLPPTLVQRATHGPPRR